MIENTGNILNFNSAFIYGGNTQKLTLETKVYSQECMMSYDEFVSRHPEIIANYKKPYYDFVTEGIEKKKKIEAPDMYDKPYNYPNGSRALIDENKNVTYIDKDGKETKFGLPESAELTTSWNGFISWRTISNDIYRMILPDGTLIEKYLMHVGETEDTTYRLVSSNGETVDISKEYGSVTSFTTPDGKRYVTPHGIAIIERKDKDGNTIGSIEYNGDSVSYKDMNGNYEMYTWMEEVPYNEIRVDKGNGFYDQVTNSGVIEHYNNEGYMIGVSYQNGYHIEIEDEKDFVIYDASNKVVKKYTYKDVDSIYFLGNGVVQLEYEDEGYVETIYYGKYLIRVQDGKTLYEGPINELNIELEDSTLIS